MDNLKQTPLHLSCIYSSDRVFKLLIENEKLLLKNIYDSSFVTLPLHCACRSNKEQSFIVESLLVKIIELKLDEMTQPKLDPNLKKKLVRTLTPIVICRFELSTEDIENQIEENEFSINKFEFIRIVDETTCYLKEIVNLQDTFEQRPLQIAIEQNYLDITNILFKFGAFPMLYAPNRTLPIHIAAKTGSVEMFFLLEKHHAISFKSDGNMNNMFHIAAFFNNIEFLKTSCEYFNQSFQKLLNFYFKELHSALEATNSNYMTPLFLAVSRSNLECVKILLEASPMSKFFIDDFDRNILHICCLHDSHNVLKYLIQLFENKVECNQNEINSENEILHCGQFNKFVGSNPSFTIQTYHMYKNTATNNLNKGMF